MTADLLVYANTTLEGREKCVCGRKDGDLDGYNRKDCACRARHNGGLSAGKSIDIILNQLQYNSPMPDSPIKGRVQNLVSSLPSNCVFI